MPTRQTLPGCWAQVARAPLHASPRFQSASVQRRRRNVTERRDDALVHILVSRSSPLHGLGFIADDDGVERGIVSVNVTEIEADKFVRKCSFP